jgi:hypothetical protein
MIRNSTSISDEVLNTRSGRPGTCWPDMGRGLSHSRIRARASSEGDCHRKGGGGTTRGRTDV